MNQFQQTASELRHRLTAVEDERDQLAAQVEELRTGRAAVSPVPASGGDPVRQQNLELSRMAEGLRRALTESEVRVEKLQEQLANLRLARDASQERAREQALKLEQLELELAELREAAESGASRTGVEPSAGLAGELALAREEGARAKEAAHAAVQQAETLQAECGRARERAASLELEMESIRERWRAFDPASSPAVAAEPEALQNARAENRELTSRLEAQRLETIDLATRYQAAQAQIKGMGASLAEARLLAKASASRPPSAPPATEQPAASRPLAGPLTGSAEAPSVAGEALSTTPEPFPVSQAQDSLREMRRCHQAYLKDPSDLSHLNELHRLAATMARQAAQSGLAAIHGLAGGLGSLIHELYHFPEQITPEALATGNEAIEFLSTVLKLRDLRQLKNPAELTICIVDDDSATCECLLMAMESVALQAISFREPVKALCHLSVAPSDLIILDVQMPGMDGFELCTSLRELEHHKHTPVLFVTGQTEPEVRARSILSGGSDFMMKPFLLCELALKALLLTAKAQLHMV